MLFLVWLLACLLLLLLLLLSCVVVVFCFCFCSFVAVVAAVCYCRLLRNVLSFERSQGQVQPQIHGYETSNRLL